MQTLQRRHALKLFGAVAASTATVNSFAQSNCAVFTPETQAALTPDTALQRLKDGNARFAAGTSIHCDLLAQVRETAGKQAPFATVLGCIDSRVPPELVFDQRVGDIFVARVAGNIASDDILGSLEFATELAGSPLIVVLGHSSCGAVKGAVDDAKLGHLTGLLAQIRPALKELNYQGVPSSKDSALVQRVAERNVHNTTAKLSQSSVLAKRIAAGKLKVVGALHDTASGKMTWFA